ncbi:MAG: histidine biosynthesis bifunctional protein HisB [Lysobacterales bacterium]|jgi:imidazoleglycerol-phosphate dehydratase/histidinol-phosphatase|nr:MAG: histidine biosynthesis bifunctional protein HisB [Xanthomonadales bacterium]
MKILFLDRDGTLIEEPPDEQVDALEKVRLMPGVIPALLRLKEAGYEFVMVSNQDGLGTPSFPEERFWPVQRFVLELFASQGIVFREVLIDRSFAHDPAPTRKPGIGLVLHYLKGGVLDFAASAMVGDRETDLQFAANLGIRGFRVGPAGEPWARVASKILGERRAELQRRTRETEIALELVLDREEQPQVETGIGFFDHMLIQLAVHGGFALRLRCRGDLEVDEHHTVEDCALALGEALRRALGDKRGIGRYGFLLPMDESLAQVALDLSGRPYFVFEGRFPREQVGGLPTELVPHFFRSLAESLGAALHLSVRGENAHHMIEACFKAVGRALRQALRREGERLPSSKGML